MTDRDKLVDILERYPAFFCDRCGEDDLSNEFSRFAAYLLANGVTVSNWRDAKTDPPEEEKPVQCFFVNCQCVGFWTKEKGYKQWFASVGDLYFECESEPDYWQPLPEGPKEESK